MSLSWWDKLRRYGRPPWKLVVHLLVAVLAVGTNLFWLALFAVSRRSA